MTNPVHDPRGSIWRVWDLHFHTPSSFDYLDKGVTNNDIVATLVSADVSVVAITDHHNIDIDRIEELRAIAKEELTVLPGIEFRTELGGSGSVHVVGILPEDRDLCLAWDTIRVKHKLEQQINQHGDEGVHVIFRDFARDIHDLGGLTVVHAGSKTNSIEEISGSTAFKQALKSEMAREASDIFEIANPANVKAYHDIVFPAIRKELPLVLCSDSHRLSDYSPPHCWLKADPSFYGLSQTIYDPRDRVFLGETPPAHVRVNENKTKYMASITYGKVEGSELDETWFHGQSIVLNPGLVAIIGNKGSGKSALSETMGLLGGCPLRDDFSFLHRDRFLLGRKPKAAHFKGSLEWADGTVTSLVLDKPNAELEERVRYIPQNYLESVCNELRAGEDSEFSRQIEQVILSHVPTGEREGHATLKSLLDDWTAEIKAGLSHAREKIRGLNIKIAETECRLLPEYRKVIEQHLELKRKELEVLEQARPAPVAKPADDAATSPEMKAKLAEAEILNTQVKGLEDLIQDNQRSQQLVKLASVSCDKLSQAVDNFEAHYEDLSIIWQAEGEQAGLAITDVVTHEVSKVVLEARTLDLSNKLDDLANEIDPLVEDSLAWRLKNTKAALSTIRTELSAPSQAHQAYLDAERDWSQKRVLLIGDLQTPESLSWYEARIAEIENHPAHLEDLVSKRAELFTEVFEGLSKWRTVLEKAYGAVQRYIGEHPLTSARAEFEFSASITEIDFVDGFFGIIHQGKRGSFCREGSTTLQRLIDSAHFASADGALSFVHEVIEHLKVDKRDDDGEEMSIENQLKEGKARSDLYDMLFCLEYLQPTYSLRWAGKDLDLLSPGERGALLLVFYLLIDKDTCPLLIDQPEENLDNQTVYKILVPCINEARLRRQIVLVTHNPNIAVVCDADQVIAANLDAEGSCTLSYASGAIENPSTSKAIVDVLEGTKPAFEKRERKYIAALPDWSM